MANVACLTDRIRQDENHGHGHDEDPRRRMLRKTLEGPACGLADHLAGPSQSLPGSRDPLQELFFTGHVFMPSKV